MEEVYYRHTYASPENRAINEEAGTLYLEIEQWVLVRAYGHLIEL